MKEDVGQHVEDRNERGDPQPKQKRKPKTTKTCKWCNSTTHKTKRSKQCPFNKSNITPDDAELTVITPVPAADDAVPTAITPSPAADVIPTPRFLTVNVMTLVTTSTPSGKQDNSFLDM